MVCTDKYNFNPNERASTLHFTMVWPGEPSRKVTWQDVMEWLRLHAPQNPAIRHTPSKYTKENG